MEDCYIKTKRDIFDNIIEKARVIQLDHLMRDFMILTHDHNEHIFQLSLYQAKLDSPMLSMYRDRDNYAKMSRKELFVALKRTLYVGGQWELLCDFYFRENFPLAPNKISVKTVVDSPTNYIRKYTFNNKTVTLTLSDSNIMIVCEITTLLIERM